VRLAIDAASSMSARARRIAGRSALPCPVSETCRVVRSKTRNPSCDSSSRTSTLTPDGVMNSASAAREKLPRSAMATSARSCLDVNSIADSLS